MDLEDIGLFFLVSGSWELLIVNMGSIECSLEMLIVNMGSIEC